MSISRSSITGRYIERPHGHLPPMRCATTQDLDLVGNGTWVQAGLGPGATLTAGTAGTTTIDGVPLEDGDEVLVKDQVLAKHNGPYTAYDTAAGLNTVLVRMSTADTPDKLEPGTIVVTHCGLDNQDLLWELAYPNLGYVMDVDDQDWTLVNYRVIGSRIYPPSATNPTTPPPIAGDTYYNTTINSTMYYDGANWYSTVSHFVTFSATSNVSAGAYLKIGQVTCDDDRGYVAPNDGAVVGMGCVRDNADVAYIETLASATPVAELYSAATVAKDRTLNGNFSEDDIITVRNKPTVSSSISNPVVWVEMKWRVI